MPTELSSHLPHPSQPWSDLKAKVRAFFELTKFGIVFLVLISTTFGFWVGSYAFRESNVLQLMMVLVGTLLLASGSAALNQVQEKSLDAQMHRTQKRPLPSGKLQTSEALAFALSLLLLGLIVLYQVRAATFWLGVSAVVSYNGLYTLWWKPNWAHAAIPGAIPGALPILMGFTAGNASLPWYTPSGIYLFLILFFWQMPHFWSLALKFKEDYKRGSVPTLPVEKGTGPALSAIALWTFAYIGLVSLAPLFVETGIFFLTITSITALKILWELFQYWRSENSSTSEKPSRHWIRFFLWINLSLILFLGAIALDYVWILEFV